MQVSVPRGHILCRTKWKNLRLVQILKDKFNIIFEDRFDFVDIFISNDTAIVVIDDNDIIDDGTLADIKRNLVKLRRAEVFQGIALIQKTTKTDSHFYKLQKFITLNLGLKLVPYLNWQECADFIIQLISIETNPNSNILSKLNKNNSQVTPVDEHVLAMLTSIPKLGSTKSQLLISHFPSLHSICNASEEQLAEIVGQNLALVIKNFFNSACH
ncbi:hypothetical protein HELRODRAFT_173292 [Helobdella robusta]|uniref:Fanconi anemia core complex-associated protein 24 pseudonuclease domain-containing protein n=1 Tax=Helobdella robusta TaxID=6412 RepID=T1F6N2_HELRO|nr:hypothetical protein HELRODRAFT_173292 [Helobdella robusta]ESO03602.1 hypothetical protein HELRODRAFT_173292 [Helobdella robusta]